MQTGGDWAKKFLEALLPIAVLCVHITYLYFMPLVRLLLPSKIDKKSTSYLPCDYSNDTFYRPRQVMQADGRWDEKFEGPPPPPPPTLCLCLYRPPPPPPHTDRLLGLVVRRPPRDRKIPGSNPVCAGIFSGSSHTSD